MPRVVVARARGGRGEMPAEMGEADEEEEGHYVPNRVTYSRISCPYLLTSP